MSRPTWADTKTICASANICCRRRTGARRVDGWSGRATPGKMRAPDRSPRSEVFVLLIPAGRPGGKSEISSTVRDGKMPRPRSTVTARPEIAGPGARLVMSSPMNSMRPLFAAIKPDMIRRTVVCQRRWFRGGPPPHLRHPETDPEESRVSVGASTSENPPGTGVRKVGWHRGSCWRYRSRPSAPGPRAAGGGSAAYG